MGRGDTVTPGKHRWGGEDTVTVTPGRREGGIL